MGHLALMDDSEAQFALTNLSQQLWRDLSLELPRPAEYMPSGSLWIAADEEEFAEIERKSRFYNEHEVRVEVLDSQQLSEAEPQLRKGLAGGLLMSTDSVCYPPVVAAFLIDQVIARRGRLFLEHAVSVFADGEVHTRQGERFAAGVIILACGAQAQKLVPNIEVNPRKGHLLITDRYPGFLRHPLLELGYLKSAHSSAADSVAFVVQPRATGQILIGSSRQYGIEDSAVDQRTLGRVLSRAIEYLPELRWHSAIRAWTGFRAATPDKLPLIGPCPGYENVYLATGHEGLGISTSLATARLLTDQIIERDSQIPREPYLPLRSFVVHG
jgi:glycine/D-amino acid oxidase-like deaminating enzyme